MYEEDMDETGSRPNSALRMGISGVGQQYCQHLVNSLISPHLDTSKPGLNTHLLRVFGEVLTNVENRVKAIFERSMQSGEATAAEPEKCVAEFQKRLHYMEEYLSACFQTRNVNFLYGKMEVEEPSPSNQHWRQAHRAMDRMKKQLHEELDITGSSLLDGLVQCRLVSDAEQESILARPTRRAKAAELVRAVAPRLDHTRLRQDFLPLLEQDHQHLAEGLSKAIEEEEETGKSEGKCCVCHFHEVVEVKRLARQLSDVVPPSVDSDLSNPALSNASKMQLLKEQVGHGQVIESLRETYPGLHSQFCLERVTSLECQCTRLREDQGSDAVDGMDGVDGLMAESLTDDGDVACMSDILSMLGDLDLREQAYHFGSETRGICLIINNMTYLQISAKISRSGSDVDVRNLTRFFKRLHFSVVTHEDLIAEEMREVFRRTANRDHSKFDCFVCFILAHGEADTIFSVDGSTIQVKDIVSSFHANKCTSLAGKPKLFFIQASRGNNFPTALVPNVSKDEAVCAEDADIFIGFPSTSKHGCFRSRHQGTWYINALIEALSKYGDHCDFQTCMTMVTQLVASKLHETIIGPVCQTPESVSTLRRSLFLSPNPVHTTPAPEFEPLPSARR